ncbi:hypothetical protein [Hugenholtzia roseola]|uniref:hypothetical protein n=1 Tax=Hugenholtzia roseola TaxID=1002 RepID=UPI0012B60F13|nr:hypothetical protein [Hugenholtzia roseola]
MKHLQTFNDTVGKPFLKLYHLPEIEALQGEWSGYATTEELIQSHKALLTYMKDLKIKYWISDARQFEGPFDGANEYFATEWIPACVQMGLRYAGFIMSSDIFTQLSAEDLAANPAMVKMGFYMRIFGNIPDAKAWFREEELAQKG